MGTNKTRLIGFEQLESRIVFAVGRALGTFEITDTANPNHTWASPYTDYANTVPENDNIVATQAATYKIHEGGIGRSSGSGWPKTDGKLVVARK